MLTKYRAKKAARQQEMAKKFRMDEFGRVAPRFGWDHRESGRAASTSPGRRYVTTTIQGAGLFPFVAGSGSPRAGVPVGRHLLYGETVACDPFTWMEEGLVTNPGMFVAGSPGIGKSSWAKRMIVGSTAYGVRPIVLGDTKGEYGSLIAGLENSQVIKVGRGLDRINPLDSGPLGQVIPRLGVEARERVSLEVRGRRLTTLLALCSLVRGAAGRPISNGEEAVLGRCVDLLSADLASTTATDPTVPEVLNLLRNPPQDLVAAAETRGEEGYEAVVSELKQTLALLLDGSLRGVFDSHTTTQISSTASAISVDISAAGAGGDTLVAAAMLTTWSYGFGMVDAASVLAEAGLERKRRHLLIMDELWAALRGAPGLVENADRLTRLNRSRGAASIFLTHSLRDLEALASEEERAKARGFVDRSAIVVLGGMPARELSEFAEIVPMTDAERALVTSWSSPETWRLGGSHPGRGRYLIKTGARVGLPVAMTLTPGELEMYDTDGAMRTE
jgi:hypothetical protein